MTKRMSDEKIKALLEMIEPGPGYRGGHVHYEVAKEWADELIELRSYAVKSHKQRIADAEAMKDPLFKTLEKMFK